MFAKMAENATHPATDPYTPTLLKYYNVQTRTEVHHCHYYINWNLHDLLPSLVVEVKWPGPAAPKTCSVRKTNEDWWISESKDQWAEESHQRTLVKLYGDFFDPLRYCNLHVELTFKKITLKYNCLEQKQLKDSEMGVDLE